MLLIDPKRLELSFYEDIPHLLHPVVTDPKKAALALQWTVGEMERRYQMLAEKGVRDISGYNQSIAADLQARSNHATDSDGEDQNDYEPLPYILVVIDELADLMEQGGKAMDRLMTRLTQRGRSAGLHIIACTQKPLAASIGSLTRSNFPVRLVGSVASPDDAKIAAGIPGTGAEKLLGRGDFLLVAKGQITRFQAAYVGEQEIREIIGQMGGSARTTRRWVSETKSSPVLAATGTDGKPPKAAAVTIASGKQSKRKGLGMMLGHQLRLIK